MFCFGQKNKIDIAMCTYIYIYIYTYVSISKRLRPHCHRALHMSAVWDVDLGASWRHPGGILGHLGGILGHLGGILEAAWGILEASWGVLEVSWRHLGVSLRHLGARWRCLGGSLGGSCRMSSFWDKFYWKTLEDHRFFKFFTNLGGCLGSGVHFGGGGLRTS